MKATRLKMTRLAVGLYAALIASPSVWASSENPFHEKSDQYQIIHCGKLLDVEEKKTLVDQHILVKNGVITDMDSSVKAPENAEKIDLADHVCMPGLMDMHVHLFTQSTKGTVDVLGTTQSSAFNALQGLRLSQKLLKMGFTTVRIPGDMDYQYANIEIRNAINRGEFVGPRMLVAPHYLSALGGHADFNSFAPDGPKVQGPMIVDGVDEIRKAIRKEFKYGGDWIKVMASGGVMSQHDDPEVAPYSDEELRVMVEETHRHKKKITAHAHGDAGVYAAVKAGFDSIEHASMMSERTAKLMAKKGTYYIPTFYVLDWILAMGESAGITPDNLAKARLVESKHQQSALMAYKHGVKMALGSDCIFPVELAIKEFGAMNRRLNDNWYVLRAGTISSAEMLGLDDQIGSLKIGKQADIVATRHSPIEDMTNIEAVSFVMKDGMVVRAPKER
jgi:imidazolonepropionase-like amidohydrolase